MNVSRNWLQTFFDAPLPQADKLVDALTFHSSEIEEVLLKDADTVLDVKVLPDKSAWMLSHRGVAKELSTILSLPMSHDPLAQQPSLSPATQALHVTIDAETCSRYAAAVVRGVKVAPSPQWLQDFLTAIGQRPINNVVDATNYVMFHLGQPLHAFDAKKLGTEDAVHNIGVRNAKAGEMIVTLTDESYELSADDMVIVDRTSDTPIGIAGVKGGKQAEVDAQTTDLVIESANFDRVAVRKTAQRLKLRTDASTRFENGVVPELAAYGLCEVVRLISDIAGGTCEGYVDVFVRQSERSPVSVSVSKVNSVLGLSLSAEDIRQTIGRFGYKQQWDEKTVTVTPPFERDDLVIAEDLIEEIGRMYGLSHIPSIVPEQVALPEINTCFYYAEAVRYILLACGFSEIFTSSFRNKDTVQLKNALASDKGCLRSELRQNMEEALVRNVPHKDLLGLSHIAVFEIGTVFDADGEHLSLALGVRTGAAYSAKKDDPLLQKALGALEDIVPAAQFVVKEGIAEANLTKAIEKLPQPDAYQSVAKQEDATYIPFSSYPSISRDIALWVQEGTEASKVEETLNNAAGALRVRTTLFDEFKKEGRVSYAFRLVFQSHEKTLTDEEVNMYMDAVYKAAEAQGWESR